MSTKTNLPIEVYLRAYFEGQVGNLATLLLEDELEREKQRNKEERERINKNLEEIRQRAEQSQKETRDLIYQQQLKRASRAGSGYNGGSGSGSGSGSVSGSSAGGAGCSSAGGRSAGGSGCAPQPMEQAKSSANSSVKIRFIALSSVSSIAHGAPSRYRRKNFFRRISI